MEVFIKLLEVLRSDLILGKTRIFLKNPAQSLLPTLVLVIRYKVRNIKYPS